MNTQRALSAAPITPGRSPSALLLGWLLVFLSIWLLSAAAQATEVALAWDSVEDERVGLYELHYGQHSGQYEASRQTTGTSVRLAQLEADTSYYFAVRACTADASLCSDFSDEVSARTPAPPAADFAASPTSGVAPLTVSFSDASAGDVNQLQWDFGDGASTTGSAPNHTYDSAGTYSVTLTATGPGGEDSATKSGYIVVSEPPPVAAMTQSTEMGTAPVTVTFNDASTGAVNARSWDLGDGTTATSGQVVHTYSNAGTYDVRLTVTGPGGSDSVLRSEAVVVEAPAVPPSAEFTADITTGKAPLTVRFADVSGGDVESWSWSFGDGGTSTAQNPSHTYDEPGRYAVTLTASGPAGSDSHTRSGYIAVAGDPSVEVGEALVDDRGLWVELDQVFTDPVVVAKITSANEADPVTVRVSDVTAEGFWLQLEEWEYLDGMHAEETVSYLAVERGVHELPDGRWLEADRIDTSVTNSLGGAPLFAPFGQTPIVLASVNTRNEADPVAVRLRNISATSFEIGLDEQEANAASHAVETIAFIAVEPGTGMLGDWHYEAGRTADTVTHRDHGLSYSSGFATAPVLFADMQSTDGPDTATLRARNVTAAGATISVEEEQSRDSEMNHTTETAGYLVLGQPRTDPTPADELVFEAGEALVDDRGLWVELDQVFTDPVVVAKI
ncbi:MAG: PKD domain-containing protein, partial [Deinococcus-Thermus bacterium]|nr:PKD domain-containing protein [Deinococcota bacterium]